MYAYLYILTTKLQNSSGSVTAAKYSILAPNVNWLDINIFLQKRKEKSKIN